MEGSPLLKNPGGDGASENARGVHFPSEVGVAWRLPFSEDYTGWFPIYVIFTFTLGTTAALSSVPFPTIAP